MLLSKLREGGGKQPIKDPMLAFVKYRTKMESFLKLDRLRFAVLDPGVVNTGFRIEDRCMISGKAETKVLTILNGKYDKEENYLINIQNSLREYSNELRKCHYILIESQMPQNLGAVRCGQHLLSTILYIVSGYNICVIEIDPRFKSKNDPTSIPPKLQKGAKSKWIKKWAIDKAIRLIEEREDKIASDILSVKGKRGGKIKQDDMCDTIIYCQEWFELLKRQYPDAWQNYSRTQPD